MRNKLIHSILNFMSFFTIFEVVNAVIVFGSNYVNTGFSVVREILQKLEKRPFFQKVKASQEKSVKTGKKSGKSRKSEGNLLTQIYFFKFS